MRGWPRFLSKPPWRMQRTVSVDLAGEVLEFQICSVTFAWNRPNNFDA